MDERGDRTPLFGDTNQTRPKSADSSPLYHDQSQSPTNVRPEISNSYVIVTARKRSFRRLCFHRCLSVCPRGGVSAPLHAGIHPPRTRGRHPPPWDQRQTPLGRHPPGRHPWADTPHPGTRGRPPWADTPLGRHPPGQTPPGQTPPCTVHAGIRSTSGRYASHWNAFLFPNRNTSWAF